MRIAVVGAGIAGLSFVYKLLRYSKKSSVDVHVYEIRRLVGLRKHCAGIVSRSTVYELNASKFIENYYDEMYFLLWDRVFRLYSRYPFAYRISREVHEQHLYEETRDRAQYLFLKRVVDIVDRGNTVLLKYRDLIDGSLRSDEYDYVVISEGYPNILAMKLGFNPVIEVFTGIQYEVESDRRLSLSELRRLYVVYGLNEKSSFSWCIPLSGRRLLIGLVTSLRGLKAIELLDKVLHRWCRVLNVWYTKRFLYGGAVIRGYPKRIRLGRLFCLGDANAMVKSVSCGGLAPIVSASKTIVEYLMGKEKEAKIHEEKLKKMLFRQYKLYRLLCFKGLKLLMSRAPMNRIEFELKPELYDHHDYLFMRILIDTALHRSFV